MPKKNPTAKQRERWSRVAALGCYVDVHFPDVNECAGYVNIHHKLGEGRNHDKVIGLCTSHHVQWTPLGFGKSIHNGGETFAKNYANEETMLAWVDKQLEEVC